jgi:hypothetical protein
MSLIGARMTNDFKAVEPLCLDTSRLIASRIYAQDPRSLEHRGLVLEYMVESLCSTLSQFRKLNGNPTVIVGAGNSAKTYDMKEVGAVWASSTLQNNHRFLQSFVRDNALGDLSDMAKMGRFAMGDAAGVKPSMGL